MQLTQLSITNFKALQNVTIPLSRFGCLIGENNSGKSSFLQALSIFFSGSKLNSSYFFDDSKPIRIAVTFDGIGDPDLARLAEEHRTRVATIVKNGRLILVRTYDIEGKSSLLYNTLTPTDPRFSAESIGALLRGQRPSQTFVNKVIESFPELANRLDSTMNQDVVKQNIQELANSLPNDVKVSADQVLPTGIDKSIMPMLPDPIYIPAVKDLADDLKTTESTPFGKILGILLPAVEAKLPEAQKLFEELNSKLNIVQQPDGSFIDGRLDEVKLIESTVEKYVRESFSNVDLRITIPPPELKTVFSSARIYANDGVEGLINSKGDGLRRAIVFSILRSYVELKSKLTPAPIPVESEISSSTINQTQIIPNPLSYLLLFEEPELYLHPKAQNILFETLKVFSKDNHVLVTTHSPMFFGPGATETFIKLRKANNPDIANKPYTVTQAIDLSNMNAKDQFQIICFENNNAAFFADIVVLVEGDSDYLLLPYIAKTLNPSWNVSRVPLHFVRITGKGNIRRYREFFSQFNIRVPVISDLDLLVGGFEHISPNAKIKTARDKLLELVDKLIVANPCVPTANEAKNAHESNELRGLWRNVKECQIALQAGRCSQPDYDQAVEAFFAWQRKSDRLEVLKNSTDPQLQQLKWNLLDLLREVDIYVLERGAIEQYYPASITGADKPTRAQNFCTCISTREEILDCCGNQVIERDGVQVIKKEFVLIFEGIFGELSVPNQNPFEDSEQTSALFSSISYGRETVRKKAIPL